MSRILAFILALGFSTAALAEVPPQLGRIAAISGAVSYHPTLDAPAAEAAINTPLTTGSRLATPPRGHATVDIAAGRFHLDGDSALTIGALGPGITRVALQHGALILHILPGGAGQVFLIETPRGILRADQPGYFEVAVARDTGTVMVSALEGGAQFNETIVLAPGMRATIAKDAAPVLEAASDDDFIRRVAAEVEASGESRLKAPNYVSPQATGFQELERYGLWVMTDKYGPVWEPQVLSDWAPFRNGRWVEIAPLGRTWIDDAPWGFAPAHYGSWAEVNGRWVWVPGNAAPAIAGVFGAGGQSKVSWIPLGPEEQVSQPPVTVHYVEADKKPETPKVVNVTTVNNTTNVTNVVKPERRRPIVVINGFVPSPPPPSPPPSLPRPGANLTGVGAAGTPIGAGVPFPGQR